jgi:hypothetical protein
MKRRGCRYVSKDCIRWAHITAIRSPGSCGGAGSGHGLRIEVIAFTVVELFLTAFTREESLPVHSTAARSRNSRGHCSVSHSTAFDFASLLLECMWQGDQNG